MPAEWQRRTLDAPPQQAVTEVVVNALSPSKSIGCSYNPHGLHDFVLAGGAMPVKEGLVEQGEPIVWPRVTVGSYAVEPIHRIRLAPVLSFVDADVNFETWDSRFGPLKSLS